MQRIPLQDLGARFRFGPEQLLSLLAIAIPLSLFGAAIIVFAAMFARSYKEAQSMLQLIILVPMLPGMLTMVYPMDGRPWLAPIPVAGQYALANDVIGGNTPHAIYFVIAAVAIAAVSFLLIWLTTRMLEREKIIFGR
jgi:sodium transport system permease protein